MPGFFFFFFEKERERGGHGIQKRCRNLGCSNWLMGVGMGVIVLSLAVSMRGIHRLHSHCSNKFQSGHRGIE